MNPHQFFEVRKASIKGVGSVGDVKLGMLLIGEQVGKIQSQTSVGRTKPFMGIVPSSCCRIGRFFPDEGGPCVMPSIEGGGKIALIRFAESCGELFQFNTCFQLGVVRQVPGNDLFLVEVTHLDGDIGEKLSYPRFAVEDDRLHGVPHALQCPPSLPVCVNGFTPDLLGIEVLLQMRRPYDADTEAPFKEGDIGYDDDRLRVMTMFL